MAPSHCNGNSYPYNSQFFDVLFIFILFILILVFIPFSLCIYFGKFQLTLSSNCFSVSICSQLICLTKAIFITVQYFSISSIFHWFFLNIFISLLTLSNCSLMHQLFSIRGLYMAIIVILNFFSDNVLIYNVSQSDSDSCSVFLKWTCFLAF